MATAISANKAELLAIANSVASEKMIDKAIVVEALEEAIQRAARARFMTTLHDADATCAARIFEACGPPI